MAIMYPKLTTAEFTTSRFTKGRELDRLFQQCLDIAIEKVTVHPEQYVFKGVSYTKEPVKDKLDEVVYQLLITYED